MKIVTKEDFIIKANMVHNCIYNYSKFIYTKAVNKSTIICLKHGEFLQNAHNHTNGKGCPKCAIIKRKILPQSFDRFLEKANKRFKNLYDYSKSNFTNWYSNIEIICKKHGSFVISPRYHLQSSGCPSCGFEKLTGGYNLTSAERNKNEWRKIDVKVYLVKCWSNEEGFYKIGITNKRIIKYRFSGTNFPYNFKFIKIIGTNLYDAVCLEFNILKEVKSIKYVPKQKFNGYTECFIPQSKEHIEFVKSLQKKL